MHSLTLLCDGEESFHTSFDKSTYTCSIIKRTINWINYSFKIRIYLQISSRLWQYSGIKKCRLESEQLVFYTRFEKPLFDFQYITGYMTFVHNLTEPCLVDVSFFNHENKNKLFIFNSLSSWKCSFPFLLV